MAERRALVTGGAGFIGSHVVEAFQAEGWEVLALDDLSSGREANVPAQASLEQVDVVEPEPLTRAFGSFRPSVVCHLAAQASVTVSVERPAYDLAVNVHGTLNVCEAAREAGAPLVYASTGGALYGDRAPFPTPETFFPEPQSPYGASKLGGELYVATWGRLHGQPNVALRLGNVYGPRQNPHGEAGVVAIFSDLLLEGRGPTVYGHGEPTRDYVHVRDVARAFLLAASAGEPAVYNVGWGRETKVLELLDHLQRAAGTEVEPDLQPLRAGELHRSALDSTRIADELGWRPEIALADGLDETYCWYAGSHSERPRGEQPK